MDNNEELGLKAIKNRSLYDIKLKKRVFVNKLIYWNNDLVIKGLNEEAYYVKDYEKTWIL